MIQLAVWAGYPAKKACLPLSCATSLSISTKHKDRLAVKASFLTYNCWNKGRCGQDLLDNSVSVIKRLYEVLVLLRYLENMKLIIVPFSNKNENTSVFLTGRK